MARITCIDYGMKRCGIAHTDNLQIAVHPLTVVDKKDLIAFLVQYLEKEEVDQLVFGHPEMDSGRISPVVQSMMDVIGVLREKKKDLNIVFHPEDFTSQRAAQVLVRSGMPKKKRRKKGALDQMSAVLILQDYLGHY